ncbi:O-antigen ligase family protein [Tistrella bauzanensis]|nr:O-antigen ligase family protein [Tistrella bauzanensis]
MQPPAPDISSGAPTRPPAPSRRAQAACDAMRLAARILVVLMPVLLVVGRAPADIALSLVVLLFLVAMAIARDAAPFRTPWMKVALVFWVWLLASAPFALADIGSAFGVSASFIRFPLFAAALSYWLIDDVTWRQRLLLCLGVVLGASAVWAVIEWIDIALLINDGRPVIRLTGPFEDNKVGIFILKLMFPVLGFLAWRALLPADRLADGPARASTRGTGLVLGYAALLLVAILLSGERMALLMALAGMLIMGLLVRARLLRRLTLALLAAAVVLGGLTAVLAPRLYDRQIASTVETVSAIGDSIHGRYWQSGLDVGALAPWTGVGGKNFRLLCPEIKAAEIAAFEDPQEIQFCATHPHNIYIEAYTEHGIPGLILFCMMIIALILALRGAGRDDRVTGAAIGVLLTLWPLATHGSFYNNWNGAVFWLATGLMLALRNAAAIERKGRPA